MSRLLFLFFEWVSLTNFKSGYFILCSIFKQDILGFAVGHHTNDANHQQGHTDSCDGQHPPLVELLGLCDRKCIRANTHIHMRRRHTFMHCRQRSTVHVHQSCAMHIQTGTHTHTLTVLHVITLCATTSDSLLFIKINCCSVNIHISNMWCIFFWLFLPAKLFHLLKYYWMNKIQIRHTVSESR